LRALVELFYDDVAQLGRFEEVEASQMPEVFRRLLNHDEHMTVTVESYHGCPVDVRVVEVHKTRTHYSRKILLARHSDGAVVQFGIVRLNLDFLGADVRQEIEAESTPLGRILIEHNVLRHVRLLSLWRIEPNAEMCQLMNLDKPTTCFGRTALIYCNGVPAVELLEIVTPV
jgi:chorismate-pyruvate lyase